MESRPTLSPRDTQLIEIRGRHRLIEELIRAGLEVAIPFRDRGVDVIAYAERAPGRFQAFPIQLKAATTTCFGIDRKYQSIAGLLIVHLWHLGEPGKEQFFAMTFGECLRVAEDAGWTKTDSWNRGKYTVTRVGQRLAQRLESFRMTTPEQWQARIATASQEK